MTDQAGTRHPIGMTHRYRATADIEPVVWNFQPILAVQNLHRKRFIQFPQADILDREIEALQQLRHGKNRRSEEHTSELQSLMRISSAVFCLKKKIMTR